MTLPDIKDLLTAVVNEYVEQVEEHEDLDTIRISTHDQRINDFRRYLQWYDEGVPRKAE